MTEVVVPLSPSYLPFLLRHSTLPLPEKEAPAVIEDATTTKSRSGRPRPRFYVEPCKIGS